MPLGNNEPVAQAAHVAEPVAPIVEPVIAEVLGNAGEVPQTDEIIQSGDLPPAGGE